MPFDYYPGGSFDTGIRNSGSQSGSSFWQQALIKYKMTVNTEPTFSFVPSASALDISRGNVVLTDSDYLMKYNSLIPPVSPKDSPFANFITSFGTSFIVANDNYLSTNEHHINLHNRNADWLATEIDNIANNNQVFNCSYICSGMQISGASSLCSSGTYSAPKGATFYNWTITQGSSLVTLSGNNTANLNLVPVGTNSGFVTMSVTFGDNWARCGNVALTKTIWVGKPSIEVQLTSDSNYVNINLISGNGIPISQQGITATSWTEIASTNGGNAGGSGFEGFGSGPNMNWTATLKITATNACGTTEITRVIEPAAPLPCGKVAYNVTSDAKNSYSAKIIDPCAKTTANTKKVDNNDISSAAVYDIYGNFIKEFKMNHFDLTNLNKGYYILNVLIKGNKLTKKILVD